MASNPFRMSTIRWLLVPAVVCLFAVIGLASSSEGRDEFKAGLTDGSPSGPSQEAKPGAAPEANIDPSLGADPTGSPSTVPNETVDPLGQSETDVEPIPEDVGNSREVDPLGSDPDIDRDPSLEGETVSLEVRADKGSVGVQIGAEPDGSSLAFPRDADGTSGPSLALSTIAGDGEDQAAARGLQRLTADGQLEPVGSEPIESREFAVSGAPGGIDLFTADGSRVEIRRPDGEPGRPDQGGDLDIVGTDSSGVVAPITPDLNGVIDLGGGVTVQLTPPPSPPADDGGSIPWRWLVLANLTLTIVSLAVAYYLYRTRPIETVTPEFVMSSPGGSENFEDFLAELLDDDDPARAIRLAFETAERGMGPLPARLATETPFEWHSRVAATHDPFAADLSSLCSRFATARFAPERPSPADRDAAVAELRSLAALAGYRHSANGRSPILAGRS